MNFPFSNFKWLQSMINFWHFKGFCTYLKVQVLGLFHVFLYHLILFNEIQLWLTLKVWLKVKHIKWIVFTKPLSNFRCNYSLHFFLYSCHCLYISIHQTFCLLWPILHILHTNIYNSTRNLFLTKYKKFQRSSKWIVAISVLNIE